MRALVEWSRKGYVKSTLYPRQNPDVDFVGLPDREIVDFGQRRRESRQSEAVNQYRKLRWLVVLQSLTGAPKASAANARQHY